MIFCCCHVCGRPPSVNIITFFLFCYDDEVIASHHHCCRRRTYRHQPLAQCFFFAPHEKVWEIKNRTASEWVSSGGANCDDKTGFCPFSRDYLARDATHCYAFCYLFCLICTVFCFCFNESVLFLCVWCPWGYMRCDVCSPVPNSSLSLAAAR